MAKYGETTYSNSRAARAQRFTVDDEELDSVQNFSVLTGDPASAALYSIGTTDTASTPLTGSIAVPANLIADTVLGADYHSMLGARIFMTATGQVGYDMKPITAVVEGLAAGAVATDSFNYAIRMANGTVSWNTVTVDIRGKAATIGIFPQDGTVTETANWQSPPNDPADRLSDDGAITAFAASGNLTTVTLTPASGNHGMVSLDPKGPTFDSAVGVIAYHFIYSVAEQAVFETHRGFGELAFTDTWTITTANGTTRSFTESVYGNIHAPIVSAGASAASIRQHGSVALNISATDHDDNASLSYQIDGVPVGSRLDDSGGMLTPDATGSYLLTGDHLAGLTLTPDPAFAGNIDLTVTVTNREGTATAQSSAAIAVAVTAAVDPPNLGAPPILDVDEERALLLGITATPAGSGQVVTSLVITGVPGDAMLISAADPSGVSSAAGIWTIAPAALADLTLLAGEETAATLHIVATATDGSNTATAATDIALSVNPVPEGPVLDGAVAATAVEGSLVTLGVTDVADDADDTLGSVTITGLPGDLTNFSGGTYSAAAGTWVGTAPQFVALSFTGGKDGVYDLAIAATTTGAEAAVTTESYTLTLNPLAPTVAPIAASGAAGSVIALDLGLTINGLSGDANTLASLAVSGIPLGATLSDGHGNSFTAILGTTSVDVHAWSYASLTITSQTQADFILSVAATESGRDGSLSATTTASEPVTIYDIGGFSSGKINSNYAPGPQISNNNSTLQLTNGGGGEFASWFNTRTFSIGKFIASFDYHATDGSDPADGMAFILQNSTAGSSALGTQGGGSGLGVMGIYPSAEVEFNLYWAHVRGTSFAVNGSTGIYNSTGAVDFWTGDKVHVALSYDGSVLNENLTDLVDNATYSASYVVNIPAIVGANAAYVGFSASTGGSTSTQTISNFIFKGGTTVLPAGAAGSPINLGLSAHPDSGVTMLTISGMPEGWRLNTGTDRGDGFWSVVTGDPATLSVTPAAEFAGAVVLQIDETWIDADGGGAGASISDNVEVFAPGNPIFALSGDDTLSGSSGSDEFVFARPIGNDRVYEFDPADDVIDLIGFGVSDYDMLRNSIAEVEGDALITLAGGATITLVGVDAQVLTSSNFVIDRDPITTNSGTMSIGDGAVMPLGGTIDNPGVIALGSSGERSELEILVPGVSFRGGGQIRLSDDPRNHVFGAGGSAVLDNVDNTIFGAGQLGVGRLTLRNEATIAATGVNPLVIDTGANTIDNTGTLRAEGAGGLVVKSSVAGSGTATIAGESSIELAAAADVAVSFDPGGAGALILDQSTLFHGSIAGFAADDKFDFRDVGFSDGTTVAYSGQASGGTLRVSDGAVTADLALRGDYSGATFDAAADSHGGTLVTLAATHAIQILSAG